MGDGAIPKVLHGVIDGFHDEPRVLATDVDGWPVLINGYLVPSGAIREEIKLPDAVAATATRFGFDGVARVEHLGREKVIVSLQRPWREDPDGLVMLGIHDFADESWGASTIRSTRRTPATWRSHGDRHFFNRGRGLETGGRDASGGGEEKVVLDLLPLRTATRGWTPDKVEGLEINVDGRVFAVTGGDGGMSPPGRPGSWN